LYQAEYAAEAPEGNRRKASCVTGQSRRVGRVCLSAAEPKPNRAKRMECVELAPAVRCVARFESGSKLHALHTLRETRPPPLLRPCNLSRVPRKSAQENNNFGYSIQRAGPRSRKYGGALRTDAPYPPLLLRHYPLVIEQPALTESWQDRIMPRDMTAALRVRLRHGIRCFKSVVASE